MPRGPAGAPRPSIQASARWPWAALTLTALLLIFAPAPRSVAAPIERHIRIEASSFDYAPAVLAVNPGDRVTLELVATDVVHGLYLDDYDLDLVAEPGRSARLTFVADRPGTYRFRCSVTCGALHPFMIGKLTVGQNWLMWRAAGLAVLAALGGTLLVRSRTAFAPGASTGGGRP